MPPFLAATSSAAATSPLLLPKIPKLPFTPPPLVSYPRTLPTTARANSKNTRNDAAPVAKTGKNPIGQEKQEALEVEAEKDVTWMKNKAQRLLKLTGSVSQAIPGPRLGPSSMPWMLAVPLTYFGLTFVGAVAKTFRRFSSPKYQRRKLVRKNAMVCKFIDDLFDKGGDALQYSALEGLAKKTGFSREDILRKYIRYALNEKPFNPELVSGLIQLKKAMMLEDSAVADILNEISSRIVANKGPVVMDLSIYSEKGLNRKLAVQALFGKVFYLSELPEFCSRDSSLVIKEIFGVTDEDVEKIRLHTLTEAGDMESLEKMINDSDLEDSYQMADGYDLEYPDKMVHNHELKGSEEMVDDSDAENSDENSSAAP